MAVLAKLLAGILGALRLLWSLLGSLSGTLFGSVDWYAPDWLRFLGRRLRTLLAATAAGARAHPGRAAAGAVLALALAGGGWAGWQWYQKLPKPRLVAYTVQPIVRTCYECEPAGSPNPLVIAFAESVAPLEAAGKALDAQQKQVRLSPALPGTWRWRDDRTLAFEPAEDWPVGQTLSVSLARKGLVAGHVRLENDGFDTLTPAFEVQVRGSEFYQDPVVATDKKAVITLAFSHPVDPATLERRIALKLYDKVADGQEKELGPVAYELGYNKLKLEAYVSSRQLQVPAKEGRLAFTLDDGVAAARGGKPSAARLTAELKVPGINSLLLNTARLEVVPDEQQEPQQTALLEFSFPVAESATPAKLKAWLLPLRHPDPAQQEDFARDQPGAPYDWSRGVDNRVLEKAEPLALTPQPGERENSELQSFRYSAPPGRYVVLRVNKGLKSFGGYVLGQTREQVLRVPEYPRELRAVAPGSLLALSGPKRLNVVSRDVPALRVEVARLLPHQLQHLVTQSRGSLGKPEFSWSFDASNLTEKFSRVERLQTLAPGKAQYTALDLAPYLKDDSGDRRGIFLLRLAAWDADKNQAVTTPQPNPWGETSEQPLEDTRMVVVTDLGLLAKRNLDGSQDVFVQSIHSGEPLSGVTVEVIGRNGQPVLERQTGADGHVKFPKLKDFTREREPVLYLARREGDSSFLPLDYRMRELDLSRFDVGGVANNADKSALSAYLFSDRGVYRPGEEIRLGAIVRTQDFSPLPKGLPLLLQVSDPRGQVVRSERLPLSAAGFEDIRHSTQLASPTGTWTFSLSIVRDQYRNDLVGSVTVLVREFEPDRLKMSAHLSTEVAQGWVSPQDLSARVDLQNLFGAPAQQRRVTATLRLTPSLPSFAAYPDYRFSDPQAAKEGFTEELAEALTDEAGAAELALRLDRFAKATYRLQLVTQGFEAEGGRSVAAQVTQLVSSMPFLVGVKPDGDLGYVSKGAERSAQLIAVDPKLAKTEAKGLTLRRMELKYLSTLVKQDNGTFKYESRRKELPLDEKPLSIPAAGLKLALDASTPGAYAYLVLDAAGQVLARVDYSVAGDANLSARLEKNAELQLTLSKKDYAPGEEIELQVNAPYTGSGLITVERDQVYAWKWFHSDTTASTQRITLPAGLEGNAYVSVSYVRDPSSAEIFTSPLSTGVAPFSIALDARRTTVTVQAPERVKPGEVASFRYATDRPSKLVLFAVDEGILQVARYTTPDPIGFLFQKKSLDVSTIQILDLILPEFRAALVGAAPGGDADGLLAKHLNPFKRRGDAPVAYWSGIVDADSTERTLRYTVPDHFNGRLRVLAVAVNDAAIGVFEGATLVRGDFILSPNAPTFVAPGDTFDVSLGVSNQAEGSGPKAQLALKLAASKGLEVLGEATQSLAVAEGHEGSLRFKVRATQDLGEASLSFTASLGEKSAKRRVSLSVRPAVPYRTTLGAVVIKAGASLDAPVPRKLYPQLREQEAGLSALPMGLAGGFVSYLGHYPYSCTEQLVSQALPALLLARWPELGRVESAAKADVSGLIAELRARQNPDGAYRYWPGSFETHEFVSVYVQQVLVEALDRGQAVPRDLLDAGNEYLRALATRDADTLEQERNGAYALYLLTRQGQTLGAEASRLRERLESRYKDAWRGDIATAYLAAAMKLMKQDAEADKLFARLEWNVARPADRWHDEMTTDAELLYLAARHFPQRLEKLPASFVDTLAQRIASNRYHSLSAATTLLALDAYAGVAAPPAAGALTLAELLADGKPRALSLPAGLFPKVEFGADAAKLRYGNAGTLPAYGLLSQSGFDLALPAEPLREGFEVLREFSAADGKPLATVKQGEELTVRLKFRSTTEASNWSVALVDLLPGGFELVVPPQGAQTLLGQASPDEAQQASAAVESEGEGEGEGDEGGDAPPAWACPICQPGTHATVSFADFREDRSVFYVAVTPELSEIVYRIKATNAGRYTVPPAYGEGLYDRAYNARSAAGSLTVQGP